MRFLSIFKTRLTGFVYPQSIFRLPVSSKIIFLTFDDGPSASSTPFILNLLSRHQAKATFFCLGKNVEQNPESFQTILKAGHRIGNHSYSHPNGWLTSASQYAEDVDRCSTLIESDLFRPPYGRITPFQFYQLRKKYKIVFWSQLVPDYDPGMQPQKEFKRLIKNVLPGSILVFHDSEKAFPQMRQILPQFLDYYSSKGFRFEALPFQEK